jgi:hypothetical protein
MHVMRELIIDITYAISIFMYLYHIAYAI